LFRVPRHQHAGRIKNLSNLLVALDSESAGTQNARYVPFDLSSPERGRNFGAYAIGAVEHGFVLAYQNESQRGADPQNTLEFGHCVFHVIFRKQLKQIAAYERIERSIGER
jgi:hypothetical protein